MKLFGLRRGKGLQGFKENVSAHNHFMFSDTSVNDAIGVHQFEHLYA